MMNTEIKQDLWNCLKTAEKPILMYGMGNGADKILKVCEQYNIVISDFFASDGFVRGHSFHGKTVLSYSQAKEKYGDFIVLLSFASSLPNVIENIKKISHEVELFAPDVPVFGDNLFNMEFYNAHLDDMKAAYSLLADDRSKFVYEQIINYKLSGKIEYLFKCESDEQSVFDEFIGSSRIENYIDLGAYNGDTIKKLMNQTDTLKSVIALEPDDRNFKKLSEWAKTVNVPKIATYKLGAWKNRATLFFDASGNRNANVSTVPNAQKFTEANVDALDNIASNFPADYIKYDVEGSEFEALIGSRQTIAEYSPLLLVSAYHRSEDLYKIPILIKELNPNYKIYLRKLRYIPAWDLNFYAMKG